MIVQGAMNSIPSAGEAIQKGASVAGAAAGGIKNAYDTVKGAATMENVGKAGGAVIDSAGEGISKAMDMAAHPTETVSKGVDAVKHAGSTAGQAISDAGSSAVQSGKGLVQSGKEAVVSAYDSAQKMTGDLQKSFMSGYNSRYKRK